MKKTEEKLLLFLREKNLIKDNDKILIGFSGGPDSLLLLHFFYKIAKKKKFKISAFHLNHMLRREESDLDEKFCKTFCTENNIEFYSEALDIKDYAKKNKLSIEEAARKCRYDLFEKYAKITGSNLIATAHNKNDNVETVLFNLFRGTGISGMKGIPIKRNNIIRPVLCLSREEIISYLETNKLEYRIDSSNLLNDYKRNYIRNSLLPQIIDNLNNNVIDSVNDFSLIFSNLFNFLEYETNIKFNEYVKNENDIIKLHLDIFERENQIFVSEVVKKIFIDLLNIEFENNDFIKINKLSLNKTGKQELLKNNYVAFKERKSIVFIKQNVNKEKLAIKLELEKKINFDKIEFYAKLIDNTKTNKSINNVEYFDYSKISNELTIRFWEDGDKFYPLGMKCSKKISDYLQEQKVESYSKRNQIVICNGNEVIWLVNHRVDNRYKVTAETKRILMIEVK